jgi:predicted metal-dependent phosphoesterase TrpH
VRIDLHTHSLASDGTLSPAGVIRAAAEAGLDVVALTDHDTAQGWAEASAAALECGIELVGGIEVSTRYEHAGVHLLAYLPDADDPGLLLALDRVLEGRRSRVPAILSRLREVGIDLSEDDVRRVALDTPATGRPHVADALVARGVVADRAEAFEKYLSPGRPGYATRSAEDLEDMVPTVVAAGGVPVVAHPWARTAGSVLTEAAFADLASLGLAGIEVDHQGHAPWMRDELRGIARNLGLVVTGSSDFHGAGKVDHDLGCNTTDPDEYARIVELASTARANRAAR